MLCGGIDVAMPTAMPCAPLASRFGTADGHDDRLFGVARIIVAPVDRIFVDALHDEARDIGHARFGVAVGGGVIAVDVAEIALPLDERIARDEVLRETHQRLVDRLVAVRMERAHHVADDLRAFLEGRAGVEPEDVHAVEDAAVHGLQPVARVGKRPPHDGGKGVGEIALLERVAQVDVDRDRRRGRRRRNGFGHGLRLPRGLSCGKAEGLREWLRSRFGRGTTVALALLCVMSGTFPEQVNFLSNARQVGV